VKTGQSLGNTSKPTHTPKKGERVGSHKKERWTREEINKQREQKEHKGEINRKKREKGGGRKKKEGGGRV